MTATTTQPPIRLGHMGINCFDVERVADFYKRVFGFIETDRGYVPQVDMTLIFLTLEPHEHHQFVLCSGRTEGEIRTDAFIGGGAGSAINQISFEMVDLAQMRRVVASFGESGIRNGMAINHGNAWAVYIRDIEGNPVELYLDTPWYTPQPCGEPLDLSLSDEEIHSRTEAFCRARPGFVPAKQWQEELAVRIEQQRAAR